MEKTSPEYPQPVWRTRRLVTRFPYNGLHNPKSGGVLYAKRRQHNQAVTALLIICLLTFLGSITFVGVLISRTIRTWQKEAPPSVTVSEPVLSPTEVKPLGKKSIVLLGSDQRSGDTSFRTDVILYITIDIDQQTVSVISFPRDMWVKAPTLYEMKINQVQNLGGFEATAAMFEANFGIKPDYYLLANFENFIASINSLDGIDVEIGQELTDDCDLPQAVNGDCTVLPGTMHMDGATALWYVRSRHTTSDFDRMRRMQEVLKGIFDRMMNINAVTHLPEIYESYSGSVETNLGLQDIIPLVPTSIQAFGDTSRIQSHAIDEDYATPSWSWDGMWILLPDEEGIRNLLSDAGIH